MKPAERARLSQLLAIESLVTLAGQIAGVFSIVFLVRTIPAQEASLFYFEAFIATTIACLLAFRIGLKRPRLWMAGAMASLCCFYLSFIFLGGRALLFVAPLFFAPYIVGFWVPFNVLYMEQTTKENRGFVSCVVFLVFPVIGVFSPLLGAYIATSVAYWVIFLCAALALMTNIFLILLGNATRSPPLAPKPSTGTLGKRLSAALFFEGAQEGVFFTATPLLAMQFATGEMALGTLFALFALVGGLASLWVGRISDKKGERARYVRIGALLSAPFILLAAFAPSLQIYTVANSAVNVALTLVPIFLFALAMDRMEKDKPSAVLTRELLLNGGRMLGAGTVVAVLFTLGGSALAVSIAYAIAAVVILGSAAVK
ncbi:MAG: hypothetical protein HZB92_07570 [Euryarchaeota archaeon]|nr:hypothetical protein [Euryarchaeota archaeon]